MGCIFPHCFSFLETMWYCHWCSVRIFCDWFTLVLFCICCKLWLGLQVILSLSLYFVVLLSEAVFVQNYPSYVGTGVLLAVRRVYIHTHIVQDLQLEIRTMQKNLDSYCFSSTVSWLITNPGTSSVPQNTHFTL